MALGVGAILHVSVQRCPADLHTILFPPAVISWSKPALAGTGPTSQGQVKGRSFILSFVQHEIRAWPVPEARKSDTNWVQSCPQEAPRLVERWTHNRELPLGGVMKCQELEVRSPGRLSG